MPTRFAASNDGTVGVAGLWQPWRVPNGEWVDTFTMLTLNADDHDLMKHYHRPDPTRPPEMQDKRMVVILPEGLYEAWLDARAANSHDFMRQFPADKLVATPEPTAAKVRSTNVKPTQQADQAGLF